MFHSRHPSSAYMGIPTRAGEPSYFTPLRPHRGVALRSRVWAEASAALIRLDRESGARKKTDCQAVVLRVQSETPMLCRRPVLRTQPNSRCSASIAGAELVFRARFFRLETGPLRGRTRTLIHPRLGPPGASTSPESGIEVSREENFLSREKRKMWLTFSYCVYL
jgi:hypothetical protein